MGRKYEGQRAVPPAEGERHRDAIHAFLSDCDGVACYLLTYRRDGLARMRPVTPFMDGWRIQVLTQDVQPKTGHIRRNPQVGFLLSGMQPRERVNDPVNVFVQATAELVDDAGEMERFLEKRERLTGRVADSPEDYRPLMILATPHYLRAEGFTGRRRPIVYRDFPGL